MKKTIIHILCLFLLLPVFAACTSESIEVNIGNSSEMTFTLKLKTSHVESRGTTSTEAGVKDYHENVISKADVFFYTDETGNAVYKISKTWDPSEEQTVTLDGSIPTDIIGDATSLHAYAIVNGPTTPEAGTDGSTITALKALTIEANEFAAVAFPMTNFVMDGKAEVTVSETDNTKSVSGEIALYRAASKIQLFVTNLSNYTDDAGYVWKPSTQGMTVSLVNGVKKGRIDVGESNDLTTGNYFSLKASDYSAADDKQRFGFGQVATTDDNETTDMNESTTYTHKPFYSYSSDWGRDTNPDQEAYLSLCIYWQKTENESNVGNPVAYYYRVPINLTGAEGFGAKKMERNAYYKIFLEVGVLGDLGENTQVELKPKYQVVDWYEEPVNVELAEYRYLVVEKNEVDMYNLNSISIAYSTSHDTKVVITSITRPYMKYITKTNASENYTEVGTTEYYVYDGENGSEGLYGVSSVEADGTIDNLYELYETCSVELKDGCIVLTHDLLNDRTQTYYDYLPYTITLRIYHTDKPEFTEEIVITQYPSCYVTWEEDKGNGTSSKGSVFVNGYQTENPYWYSCPNIFSPSNNENNPYMLIFTVTAFDSSYGKDFIITDSRESEIDNLNYTFASAPAKHGTTPREGLSYYYPTRVDNPNYISPKFRIASAYGQPGAAEMSATTVKYRCASYQEYGYPAGRWRVPTAAELKYIGQMCVEEKIPYIFNSGKDYWSATGTWTFNTGTSFTESTATSASVRCVYDDWYWGTVDKCDVNTFTWGDTPRN